MPDTRAVLTTYAPGDLVVCCDSCHKLIPRNWAQSRKLQLVRCNVYARGQWDRLEHFHVACYDQAGQPHGDPGRFRNPSYYIGPGALARPTSVRYQVDA